MASAPAKNTNKDRTPSRLGRGLSSLIGGPVSVEPPAPDAQPARSQPVGPDVVRMEAELVRPTRPAAAATSPPSDNTTPSEPADERGGDPNAAPGGRRLLYLPLDAIVPSPYQPRSDPSEGGLADLSRSIRESGVMQPIVVRERASGEPRYELIAGERRWRASRLAGLEVIPAVVAQVDDRTAAEWALVENIQREDLNAVDRARAFRTLAETFDLTHAQVAERVGLDRATVANAIRLTELEPAILDLLARNQLSAGHAKALLAAPAGAARVALAKRVIEGDWSVRALEHHLREAAAEAHAAEPANTGAGAGAPAAGGAPKKERSAQIVALEKQLSEHLSAKVRIKARPGANKGRVEIDFYDLDHFDALMDRMGFTPH